MVNSLFQNNPAECIPTGVTRKDYLDVMECVVDAYGVPLLEQQLSLDDSVYHFTAFRTSLMLAYLISSGRKPELLPLWQQVTEKSVRTLEHSRNSAYNDLTLQDLCISFLLMPDYIPCRWLEVLRNTQPDTHYRFQSESEMNNMVVYGALGMYLREKLTGASCKAYFDKVMPWIINRLDENGMFDDHDHALLYDLTVRVRLEQLLWYGYNGSWAEPLRIALNRGAEISLQMQSAAFQIPYGGRSNQFLHNEALQTSLFEFAANRFHKLGHHQKAKQLKRAAHLSFLTLKRYLELPGGAKHIRNHFPQDCIYGIDNYGTFPRYMNALATFIGCGYLACDDAIDEAPCPAEQGGYVTATGNRFGKIFANAAGQSVEYAFFADTKHEPAGLGRYHAAGICAELGLSMPFVQSPAYRLSRDRIPFDILGPNPLTAEWETYITDPIPSQTTAISPGLTDADGNRILLCQTQSPSGYEILCQQADRVSFRINWLSGTETITLDSQGLHLSFQGNAWHTGTVFWCIPLLADNGGEKTVITALPSQITVRLGKEILTVTTNATLTLSQSPCANRNGIYRVLYADSGSSQCDILLKLSHT